MNQQGEQQQQPQQPVQPMSIPQNQAQSIVNNIPTPQQAQAMQQPQKSLQVRFEDDLILTVLPEQVNDMRFLELYDEVSENEFKIPKLLKFMFGAEAYEGIHKYYNDKGQRFEITKMGEVFEKLDKDLNSNPDFLRQ